MDTSTTNTTIYCVFSEFFFYSSKSVSYREKYSKGPYSGMKFENCKKASLTFLASAAWGLISGMNEKRVSGPFFKNYPATAVFHFSKVGNIVSKWRF